MKKSSLSEKDFKEKLKKCNLNQKELSVQLGIAEVTVNKWYKTTKMPLWVENYINTYIKMTQYHEVVSKMKEVNKLVKTVF